MLDATTLHASGVVPTPVAIIYTVLLSFLLSTLVGVAYVKTFKGLSYSQGFVQALILGGMIAATVMQAIGDSLAQGLGVLGALAIIRFRTNFKDPRDIIFMFASLAAGIACGVQGYIIAVVGTLAFVLVAVVLSLSHLGRASFFDGLLRFSLSNKDASKSCIESILQSCCKTFALVTLREIQQGQRLEYAYQIRFKAGKSGDELLERLQKEIDSVEGVSLMLQEATVEL